MNNLLNSKNKRKNKDILGGINSTIIKSSKDDLAKLEYHQNS